ncbi:MAG TPA: hypothetical protein VFT44_12000 [Pyrinomonadaceae bacterium]|nr:hypothetical protein [Pyrinomonadaceae bacterium]
MAEPTFIGNWNLFRGSVTDEGREVSVKNSTCRIDKRHLNLLSTDYFNPVSSRRQVFVNGTGSNKF